MSGPKVRISKGFLDSLADLSPQAQRRVREALEKMLTGFERGGLRLHTVGRWQSLSPTMDVRVIAALQGDTITLVHVGQHDDAYKWAERHQPVFDSDNLVAVVDLSAVKHTTDDSSSRSHRSYPRLPASVADFLNSIPADDEDGLLEAISNLAPELQEAALAGATAEWTPGAAPSDIVVLADDEALREALRWPRAAWRLFLHPRQRFVVEMPVSNHMLLRGGPGTGKTVTLVHRYVRLKRAAARTGDKPPGLIALTPTTRVVIRDLLAQLGESDVRVHVASEFSDNPVAMERGLRAYSTVLIDEAQDLPTRFVATLLEALERKRSIPPLLIAYDANQAVVNPTGGALERLAKAADVLTLTYCYRSTNEIVSHALNTLNKLHSGFQGKDFKAEYLISASRDASTSRYVAALRGPEVRVSRSSLVEWTEAAREAVNDLLRSYDRSDVAVVLVGDKDGSTREHQAELCRFVTVPVLMPAEVKGMEFLAGVVVDLIGPASSSPHPARVTPAKYESLSGLYVGLTRFRDRVSVVTTWSGSPVLP